MFSDVSRESRIPAIHHPPRPIRAMVGEALVHRDRKLEKSYAKTGRRSESVTAIATPRTTPLAPGVAIHPGYAPTADGI